MADQRRLVVVIGATGFQGRGVVSALLGPKVTDKFPGPFEYHLKALTRNINSRSALDLKADFPSIELIHWDPDDDQSIISAFESAYAVFSVTSTFMLPLDTEEQMATAEVTFGKRIADAAQVAGVKHFIWSNLPSISQASHGKYVRAYHFDKKEEVARHLQSLPSLPTTSLVAGFFFTNFRRSVYAQHDAESKTVRLMLTGPPTAKMGFVDPIHDVGVFTRAVLDKGPPSGNFEEFVVQGPNQSLEALGEALAKVTGDRVRTEQISVDEFGDLVAREFGLKRDSIAVTAMTDMGAWFAEAPPSENTAYGLMAPDEVEKAERALGVRASSFEEFLERHGPLGL